MSFPAKNLACVLGEQRNGRQQILVETVDGVQEAVVNAKAVLPDGSGITVRANDQSFEDRVIVWPPGPPSPRFEVKPNQLSSP